MNDYPKRSYTWRPKPRFRTVEQLKEELLKHPDVVDVEVTTWEMVKGMTQSVLEETKKKKTRENKK